MFIVLIGIIATLAALLVQKSQLQQLTAIWDSESLSFQLKYALGWAWKLIKVFSTQIAVQ